MGDLRAQVSQLPNTTDAYTTSQLTEINLTTQQHQYDLTELRNQLQQPPQVIIAQLDQHPAAQQPKQLFLWFCAEKILNTYLLDRIKKWVNFYYQL